MIVYDFLCSNTKARLISKESGDLIISKFVESFVDLEKASRYILLWNSLKSDILIERTSVDWDKLKETSYNFQNIVFAYLERHKIVIETELNEILSAIKQREPWEENDDITIFDEGFNWFIAFTHEEEIIQGRIETKNKNEE